MKTIQSTCNYCSIACNLDFHATDNHITKIVPTRHYPVNKGFSCIKGISLDKQQTLKTCSPLPRIKQKDGTFTHLSWEEAYKEAATRLLAIKETHGGDAIAGISTGQLPLEEMALLGHIMRNHLKGNLDGNTRLCMATSVVAYKQSFGFDAPPYTLKDFELSDTIFLIGANPVVAHPIIWDRIRENKNPDCQIIVIDPRYSESAKRAHHWYPLAPKSDCTLFYGLAHLLIKKDYLDHDYITKHTENFDGFKALVADYTPEHVSEVTGLSIDALHELVNKIHQGKNVSFWWTMGVNQGYEAVRTAQSIINIALMTGNMGRPGTGANSITGQCNAMGSRLFSYTTGVYGGGDFDNPVRRARMCEVLGEVDSDLINKPTLPYNVIIDKILQGEIKALWVVSTNPRHSWINNTQFQKAMDRLELLIVQDLYEDTNTSKTCDIFLPVVSGLKKRGTYINTERRLSALCPVLSKMPDEKTDFEVFLGMGTALGMGKRLDKWQSPAAVFELMKACTEGMPCDITGVDFHALEGSRGVQWPFKTGDTLVEDERRLFEDGCYYTPSKKAQFMFDPVTPNPLPLTDAFPYLLNTGRDTVGQWHTQTRTREIKIVKEAYNGEPYAYIHPELAKEHDILDNTYFEIASIVGTSAQFIARFSTNIPKNQLYAPLHYVETNTLTPSIFDSFSKEPSYKATPVIISSLKGGTKNEAY